MAALGRGFRKIRRRHKLFGLLRLFRIPNLSLIVLGQVMVVSRFSAEELQIQNLLSREMLVLMIASLASAAGGYIINDYHDVKMDQINKPSRVIVGRLVTRRKALLSYFLLNLIALFSGILLGKKILLGIFLSNLMLWIYSVRLKCIPLIGNLVVAALVAWSLYFPSLCFHLDEGKLSFFSLFAFFTNLIRELVKDLEDLRGDRQHGCKTFAGTYSLPSNRLLIQLLSGMLGLVLLLSVFRLNGTWPWAGLILIIAFIPFLIRLQSADQKKDFTALSRLLKRIMLLGTAGILLS